MRISIVTIAYNGADSITRLVETARSQSHQLRFHLFLHSRHAPTVSECERLARAAEVRYYPYGVNRGLSRSWNEGMLNAYADGAEVVLLVNDDIYFSAGDVDKLAEKARQAWASYIITCAGFHLGYKRPWPSHGYSCFAINPVALEKLGCFDENFFPIYCEDQDYAYRARLAGLAEENCADTMVYHGGSSTIFADPVLREQNRLTHERNLIYYRRKWGGDSGQETFRRPFNHSGFDHYIPPEQRRAPYGVDYDRTDQEIVRI